MIFPTKERMYKQLPLAECVKDLIKVDFDCVELSDSGSENYDEVTEVKDDVKFEAAKSEQQTCVTVVNDSAVRKSIEKKHKCPHCDYKTHRLYNLKMHGNKHTTERPFHCTFCAYSSTNKRRLTIHTKRCHTDPKIVETHRCDLCPYETKMLTNLKRHKKGHDKQMLFKCEMCFKLIKSEELFVLHMKRMHGVHHSETDQDYSISQYNRLKQAQVESENNVHQCHFCPYKGSTGYRLTQHMYKHKQDGKKGNGGKRKRQRQETSELYKCFDCPFQCARAVDLMFHVDRKHRLQPSTK